MTATTIDKRLADAYDGLRALDTDDDKKLYYLEQIETLHKERDEGRKAAIDRGIASVVERGFGRLDYSPAECAGIETLVDRLASTLEEAEIGEELILKICEDWADRMAESPIRAKMELAENLDRDLTNGDSVPGGILDRALDEVIATLTPYGEKAHGWYWSTVMQEK